MGDITKLPKWAQSHIRSLETQRDAALNQLSKFTDEQTPARIWVNDLACTGGSRGVASRKRYVQSRSIEIDNDGVFLSILLRKPHEISLSWGAEEFRSSGDVAFIPESYMQARLVAHKAMRLR